MRNRVVDIGWGESIEDGKSFCRIYFSLHFSVNPLFNVIECDEATSGWLVIDTRSVSSKVTHSISGFIFDKSKRKMKWKLARWRETPSHHDLRITISVELKSMNFKYNHNIFLCHYFKASASTKKSEWNKMNEKLMRNEWKFNCSETAAAGKCLNIPSVVRFEN